MLLPALTTTSQNSTSCGLISYSEEKEGTFLLWGLSCTQVRVRESVACTFYEFRFSVLGASSLEVRLVTSFPDSGG